VLRLIALLIVLLVVVAGGATLKIEKLCTTTNQLNSASNSLPRNFPDKSYLACSWRIGWRY
jgi:hypothetical protein